MFRIVTIIMDIFPAAVILVPLLLMLQCTLWKPILLEIKFWMIALALYLAAVFSVVGIPDIKYMRIDLQVWLLPFVDIVNAPLAYIKNTVLNILLFLPFGFLLPMIWKKFQILRNTVLVGFAMSFAIELSQIFTWRLTDVDDLITNTLGIVIGYYAAQIFFRKRKIMKGQRDNPKELLIILGCTSSVDYRE